MSGLKDLGGWYDAPPASARHPQGTLVAEPSIANGCWACADRNTARGMAPRARSCALRARKGWLTCNPHRKRERAARALQKQLASARAAQASKPAEVA